MPAVIIPPTIDDSQLIFDETETREILIFFWPGLRREIAEMSVTNETRRLAQSLLISGIEASYAMGYLQIVFETIANPKGGLKKMGQKLAKAAAKHWWKHTKAKDLENIRIYESVRATISNHYSSMIRLMISGEASLRLTPFYAALQGPSQAWV